MKNKKTILLVLVVLIAAISIPHTIYLSNTGSRGGYKVFWDIGIILLGLGLLGYYAYLSTETADSQPQLVIVGLFTMIATIHILRLFFGGLPV